MSKIDNGGPAFPYYETGDCGVREGMSLRDYFAAKALGGIEASQGNSGEFISTVEKVAARAYELADAMLSARKSREPGQQQPTGWIEWNGGECPVQKGASFFVRFRDGAEFDVGTGKGLIWNHEGTSADIIAYRIVSNGDQK